MGPAFLEIERAAGKYAVYASVNSMIRLSKVEAAVFESGRS